MLNFSKLAISAYAKPREIKSRIAASRCVNGLLRGLDSQPNGGIKQRNRDSYPRAIEGDKGTAPAFMSMMAWAMSCKPESL